MSSKLNAHLQTVMAPFTHYLDRYIEDRRRAGTNVCDFAFGNPHDMPLPEYGAALQRRAAPQNKDWFAYKFNEESSQRHVAATLKQRFGIPFEPDDVFMTGGAAGALSLAFATLLDPGDEVIINLPPWFFYESYIAACHGVTIKVKVKPGDFDLDLEAIQAAITPRTRAVVVNSPNNPTGRIYTASTLSALAGILTDASRKHGRPTYLISDEAYSRILLDGNAFVTPTAFYPHSFLIYTYGKTLLTPGQKLGYLALPPTMPDREAMRRALFMAQITRGWTFPDAIMQYSLPDIEKLIIDLEVIQHRRDWMMRELGAMGYQMKAPEGTFYLLVRSPDPDDVAFTDLLAEQGIMCLPGSVAEIPGHFRISLTANEDMIARSLPGFARAISKMET